MSHKTRFKCANCGMIYDRVESEPGDNQWSVLCCPECESNAYDICSNQPEHLNRKYKQEQE